MLIDPNTWAQDGATALAEWEPSDDGRYLVYGVQDGGTTGARCACWTWRAAACCPTRSSG
jgi:hypothetical protein